jgi:hypothetical protein
MTSRQTPLPIGFHKIGTLVNVATAFIVMAVGLVATYMFPRFAA